MIYRKTKKSSKKSKLKKRPNSPKNHIDLSKSLTRSFISITDTASRKAISRQLERKISQKSLNSMRSSDSLARNLKGKKIRKIEEIMRAEAQRLERKRQEIRKQLGEVKREIQIAVRARSDRGLTQKAIKEKLDGLKGVQRKLIKGNKLLKSDMKVSEGAKMAGVDQKIIYLRKVAQGVFKEAKVRLKKIDENVLRHLGQIKEKVLHYKKFILQSSFIN